MTNYKKFRIISEYRSNAPDYRWIRFNLDDYVNYKSDRRDYIYCEEIYPFDTYREGDYLEIDLEITKHYSSDHNFGGNNVVRKISSHSVSVRGQDIAERLIREVNSQPPGKVEFEHRIEHRDRSPERFIYRRNY